MKTATFATMHFSIAFAVAYVVTGDVWVGGLLAVIEPAVNTVGYTLHEWVWQRRAHATPTDYQLTA